MPQPNSLSDPLSVIPADQIRNLLPYPALVSALEKAFALHSHAPERAHYQMGDDWGTDAQMLIMPAWREDQFTGVKLLSLYPDNPKRGLPNITGLYCLFDGANGKPVALMDAGEITRRRTAATSVLAARYLAPKKPKNHLLIGTGALAQPFIEAYHAHFDCENIWLWGRNPEKSQNIVASFDGRIPSLSAVDDLPNCARQAQIITTLTTARTPVLKGDWVSPGTHLDLVGSYRPDMRETDDSALLKSHLFVDIRDGAPRESGDLTQPLKQGVIQMSDIQADLGQLVTGQRQGRTATDAITLFKSAGAAIEDLAAAVLIYQTLNPQVLRP